MSAPTLAAHAPPTPRTPRLTVVIVNYNGWDDVARLASTLADEPEARSGECEVVVVDNASDGPVPQTLARSSDAVRVILRSDNGGFSVGVNAGFASCRSPWLLVLNPDVVVEAGLLARVFARIDHQESRPEGPAAIVGFLLKNEDGSRQPSVGAPIGLFRSLRGQFLPRSRRKYEGQARTRPGPVAWVTGACMLIDAGVMRELGGMDEDFFLYYEEVALCQSARKLGRRVEFDDSVSIVHLRPLQDRPVSPRMRVITRHSKLLYFRKHLPRWQFLALARVVAIEARLQAARSSDPDEARSWAAIARMARGMRAGAEIRGREVLALADSTVTPEGVRRDHPATIGPRAARPRRKANRP